MKKIKFLALVGIICILGSCAPPQGKRAQLAKLEKQRDSLTEQIEKLKQELNGSQAAANTEPKLTHVNIAPVAQGLFQHYIKVQGTIESDNNILLPPSSPGIVKKIHVSAGDRVKKGQLLAELDGAILESTIAELENSLALAKTIFQRQQRLWKKNIGSEIEFLQAKNNKESLEKKLETVREQYKLTRLISPISGTVDDVLIKEGEMALAGYGAIHIVQLSNLKIKADLSENYISRIKKNDQVLVLIPSLGKELELKIEAVSQVIDSKNRTFHLEIKIPASEQEVKPNMLTVLTINDYSNPDAITVPHKILQETGQEYFLFVAVQTNGSWVAQRRSVTIGEDYGDNVEIIEGLQAGEHVVIFGYQNLSDGQALSVNIATE